MISCFSARIRRTVAVLTAGLLLTAQGACESPSARNPEKTEQTQGFELLISPINKLYYAPFLREEPSGTEDNAYALKIRKMVDADPPQLSLSAESADSFRSGALAASSLQGRSWLAPLVEAGTSGLLTDADVRAVRRLRTADGAFNEPQDDHSDARKAADTASALEILAACGALTADDRQVTGEWLNTAIHRNTDVRTVADLVRSLQILGMPVPAVNTHAPRSTSDFARLNEKERYDALLDAYSVAVIARARQESANLDRAVWLHVLQANVRGLEYRDLYYLVYVVLAAGAPKSNLVPVLSRLEDEELGNGSVRNTNNLAGSTGTTVWALRLRLMAEASVHEPEQIKALTTAARQHPSADPTESLLVDVGRLLAGDQSAREALTRQCSSKAMVPGTINLDNVDKWSQVALACSEAGATVARPTVSEWSLDEPRGVTAAATLVTGYADSGMAGQTPSLIERHRLRDWAVNPERISGTMAYATVIRAYLIVGGTVDDEVLAAIQRSIDTRRGCRQLPSLYRADARQVGCDFKATWAVWKLKALVDSSHQNPRPSVIDESEHGS